MRQHLARGAVLRGTRRGGLEALRARFEVALPPVARATLRAMQEVGRYRMLRAIGRGGMAEVFEAEAVGEQGFRRRVAIKRMLGELSGDPSAARMFLDEARIASRLYHANIVAVMDYGVSDGAPFQVLEFVDGVDAARLRELGTRAGDAMPIEVALHICAQVAQALAYAHGLRDDAGMALGIVHRDVSPSNVLVSWAGDVKLTDFGIALARDRVEETAAGVTKGKLAYMAPEQAVRGRVDARADLFALGCVLHTLLTGYSPLSREGAMMDLLAGHDLVLDSSLPDDVRDLVASATHATKSGRYPDAQAMVDALGRTLARRMEGDPRAVLRSWLGRVRPDGGERVAEPGALDALLDVELVLAAGESGIRRFDTTRNERCGGPGAATASARQPTADPRSPSEQPDAIDAGEEAIVRVARGRGFRIGGWAAACALLVLGFVSWRIASYHRSAHEAGVIVQAAGTPHASVPAVARSELPGPAVRPRVPGSEAPSAVTVGDAGMAHHAESRTGSHAGSRPVHLAALPVEPPPSAPAPQSPVPTPVPAAPVRAMTEGAGTLRIGGERARRAAILVDGVHRGHGPAQITLPVGPHTLELILEDGSSLGSDTIEVTPYHTASHPLFRRYD